MQWKILADKTYTDPFWRMLLHFFFWSFFLGSSYYYRTISFGGVLNDKTNFLLVLKDTVLLLMFYYPLLYIGIFRFFSRGKIVRGLLFTIALVFFYATAGSYGDKQIILGCVECATSLNRVSPSYYLFLHRGIVNIVLARVLSLGILYQLVTLLSLPLAIKLSRSYFRQTVLRLQLAKDNLQLEFNFLKSQVKPHFLFNTLNNIYSLVIHDRKQQAADTIARLSGFMRYTLYECNEDKVYLEKEVRMLQDYIELEKIRLNFTRVSFNYQADTALYTIPPLLIAPALENAFKYTGDQSTADYILLEIAVTQGWFRLKMDNTFDPARPAKPGGLGLANLQKRLAHHYPATFAYAARIRENVYSLEINCFLT
ncbi:MAG: sensor histidine kinase [Puia sp.]